MKDSLQNLVSKLLVRSGDVIARDDQSVLHLVFSEPHLRFLAVKIYRRDFLADQRMLCLFQETGGGLRTAYVPGVAYPLDFGVVDARFYQVMELLPGGSLQDLLAVTGPLAPEAVVRLGRLLLPAVRGLVSDHGIRPVLDAARIQVWPSAGSDGPWRAGLADYDPRPARNPGSVASEQSAIADLIALLRASGGALMAAEAVCYSEFWRRITDCLPVTFQELEELLGELPLDDPEATALPVAALNRASLSWFPKPAELPDRFEYHRDGAACGLPTAYEATDVFRGGLRWVHILPPERITGLSLEPYFRQGTNLTQRPGQTVGFLPVDSVMRDPCCRLFAESTTGGICLADLLQKRGKLSNEELLALLRRISDTLAQVRSGGWLTPPLSSRDVYLFPAKGQSSTTFFGNLTDSAAFEIKLRSFPSNLLGRDLTGLEPLISCPEALARTFLPEYSFVILAFGLTREACGHEGIPAHVVACFRSALQFPLANHSAAREVLLTSLARALATNPRDVFPASSSLRRLAPGRPQVQALGLRLAVAASALLVLAAFGHLALQESTAQAPAVVATVVPVAPTVIPANTPPSVPVNMAPSVPVNMAPSVPVATSTATALDLQRARTILESRKRDALLMDLGRLRDGWATADPTQGLFAAATAFLTGGSPAGDKDAPGENGKLRAQPLSAPAQRDSYPLHQRELAAAGNVDAMLWMGDYLSASLAPADQTEAAVFFREAARGGNSDAMYKLAECHFRGRGLPRDESAAVDWLRRAHEAGNARATDVLATCYAVGTVLPKDQARAAQLYREAIDRGNRESLGNLGFLYLTGDGVSPNQGEAYRLFRQGAQEEALWSMVISALCLEHGVGTPANSGEARTLFVKAARLGHPGAIRWCNVHGVGI